MSRKRKEPKLRTGQTLDQRQRKKDDSFKTLLSRSKVCSRVSGRSTRPTSATRCPYPSRKSLQFELKTCSRGWTHPRRKSVATQRKDTPPRTLTHPAPSVVTSLSVDLSVLAPWQGPSGEKVATSQGTVLGVPPANVLSAARLGTFATPAPSTTSRKARSGRASSRQPRHLSPHLTRPSPPGARQCWRVR